MSNTQTSPLHTTQYTHHSCLTKSRTIPIATEKEKPDILTYDIQIYDPGLNGSFVNHSLGAGDSGM